MSYSYILPLTIDHTKVAGELTHFPVLISATIATLKTAANGGHVQNVNGYDIQFFADSALFNPLTYEIESWDATTGAIIAWVRIPALSALADTVIYLAYGDSSITTSRANASGVWAGYRAVYHFGSASTLSLADSTGNGLTLTNTNAVTAGTGKVRGAGSFASASSQYLSFSDAQTHTQLSLSVWVKFNSGADLGTERGCFVANVNSTDTVVAEYNGTYWRCYASTASVVGSSVPDTTVWHHLVVTAANSGNVKLYVNGQLIGQSALPYNLGAVTSVDIGQWGGVYYWNGLIDEARVSTVELSASWIATEYANQNSPSTFVTVGSESSFASNVTSAIASVLIGGFELVTNTLVRGFEITDSINDRLGTCKMSIFGSPADLNTWLIPGATVEVLGSTTTASSAGGGGEFGNIEFGNQTFGGGSPGTSTVRLFYGRVISVAPIGHIVGASGTGYTEFVLTCRNYGDLLDATIITTAVSYAAVTDQAVITALFAAYLPEISTAAVDTVSAISTITFDNISLRQALEQIVNLTGAQFYVDAQKVLQYHSPAATAAPFGISDTPDNVTTFNPLYLPTYLLDFSNGANRVKVIGALSTGGTPITSTRNSTTSQTLYGIKSRVLVDRNITTTGQADARGDVELARYATPIQSGTFATFLDGLAIGQLIPVTLNSLNVSGSFLISKVTRTYPSTDSTKYIVEFGPYQPDLARALRKALTEAVQPPQTPYAIPPPLSITPGSFAATIQPVLIVNSLPTLPNTTYPADSVVILTSDHKLYRNAAGTWTAAVPAVDLTGQVITTQITDGAITTPKITALSITSSLIAASAITSGKVATNAITAGTIAAGAIVAGDGVISNLAITNAMIANATITGAKIANATITNALINDLSADKLTAGTINASVITVSNLSASNIVSGTLNCSLITVTNLSASSITTGTMSASRISAGTMSIGSGSLLVSGSGGTVTLGASGDIDASSNLTVNNIFMRASQVLQVGGTQVLTSRQTGPGVASFSTLGDAQTWCANLLVGLQNHGLLS